VELIGAEDGIALLDAIFVTVGDAKRDETIPTTTTTTTTTTPKPGEGGSGGGGSTSVHFASSLLILGLFMPFHSLQS
jgi:hypothetical protein